ncbi:MAG: right-handed parallel beta-helix repeat-containing protein [Candidatus Thorarchaeota archaeon]
MNRKVIISSLIVLFAFLLSNQHNYTKSVDTIFTNKTLILTDHVPIEIDSNSDFETLGCPGDGSLDDPYIIENYNIESTGALSYGIYITGTTAHFIIRNCYIVQDYFGIYIREVTPYTSKIINNTCLGKTNTSIGIVVETRGCSVINNTCYNSSQGIRLILAKFITIKGNRISNCYDQGINIHLSYSNNITYNELTNCTEFGVALVGGLSYYNLVHHNIFINNAFVETYDIDGELFGNITSQAYDDGHQNTWYDEESKTGNYYSDYTGKGDYLINGDAESVDIYPKRVGADRSSFLFMISLISIIFLALRRRNRNDV